jgi:hypothetical protein
LNHYLTALYHFNMSEIDEKYLETLEALFFTTRNLQQYERKEESALMILDELRAIINDFATKVDTLQGERKNNALKLINSLKKIFDYIGSIYLQELYWRKKNRENEAALILAAGEIDKLQAELNTIEKASNTEL